MSGSLGSVLRAGAPPAPIRIARLITRLNIGGPAIQAATLSSELAASDFRTLLVHGALGTAEGDMSDLVPGSVETVYLPALRRPIAPLADARAFKQILRALVRFRPAIVHTHTAKAGTLGRLAALTYNRTAGRKAPARLVHTYHGHVLEGYFSRRQAALFVSFERRLARSTDALVAVSPWIQEDLVQNHRIGRADQFRVIPLGFDLSPFAAIDDRARLTARATLALPPSASIVTTVGRLTAVKQHELFLEMAALVARRRPEAVFLIAGDGELRGQLERTVVNTGLQERVRFLGWRRDLPAIYAATDVFALTSRNEGTPVALIESMAAGVPGVSTDVGGVRDVIPDSDLGLRVQTGDVGALAEAVCRLLDAPERRRQMGDRARQWVLARYGLERLVADHIRLYEQLLQKRG